MASSAFLENGRGLPDAENASPAYVALHVLSPSLPPPSRFTLNDLPRATTIAGLKTRISQSIPSQPSLENQRLIYRGRPLVNHHDTLEGILEPPGVSIPRWRYRVRAVKKQDTDISGFMGFRNPNIRYTLSFLQHPHRLRVSLRMRLRLPNSPTQLSQPLFSTLNGLRYQVFHKLQG